MIRSTVASDADPIVGMFDMEGMKAEDDPEGRPPVDSARWGAYYWLPRPGGDGVSWGIFTCGDAGLDPDAGHDELWPAVVDRLVAAWGQDARALRGRLIDHYSGLPRGRVTRRRTSFLILHGGDGPVPGWREAVVGRFHLEGRRVKILFGEHERMIAGDPEAVEEALGLELGLRVEDDRARERPERERPSKSIGSTPWPSRVSAESSTSRVLLVRGRRDLPLPLPEEPDPGIRLVRRRFNPSPVRDAGGLVGGRIAPKRRVHLRQDVLGEARPARVAVLVQEREEPPSMVIQRGPLTGKSAEPHEHQGMQADLQGGEDVSNGGFRLEWGEPETHRFRRRRRPTRSEDQLRDVPGNASGRCVAPRLGPSLIRQPSDLLRFVGIERPRPVAVEPEEPDGADRDALARDRDGRGAVDVEQQRREPRRVSRSQPVEVPGDLRVVVHHPEGRSTRLRTIPGDVLASWVGSEQGRDGGEIPSASGIPDDFHRNTLQFASPSNHDDPADRRSLTDVDDRSGSPSSRIHLPAPIRMEPAQEGGSTSRRG
ncbi:hypothetical protein [Paludisphaera sp.]|uniref:hypothetical protein n=1 Tax=Paludisphaera sp. TaxID=2017432 RepID=UPI00301D81EE